ncbi:hypothetical protein C5167_026017 [Papaver somniferum]|nr:hypothetical protein C5167_026017 [Papaver somniferum]
MDCYHIGPQCTYHCGQYNGKIVEYDKVYEGGRIIVLETCAGILVLKRYSLHGIDRIQTGLSSFISNGEDENHGEEGNENLLQQQKQRLDKAKEIFERALNYYRENATELKDERAMLLDEWLNTESEFGSIGDASLVQKKLQKKIKKRKDISSDEDPMAYQEYYDYTFPEKMGAVS